MGEKTATREAYGRALAALGKTDGRIVALDADLSKSTKTADFAAVCPERFFNAGIAEQNMAGVAAGLAASGKIPFISTFAVFAAGRAFEQIRNSIAYPGLNVKIAATHAGITVGEDGGSHQAIEDIALMRVLPGMSVVVPADGVETASAVGVLARHEGPAYLRLGRLATPQVHADDYEFVLGKGVLLREGADVAIFACGMMVAPALQAARLLQEEGVSAAVANISTIKPLDEELVIRLAASCGAAVTAEEHSVIGGLGGAVAECLAENCPVPLGRVGLQDRFGQSGSPAELLRHYGLTEQAIAEKCREVLRRKRA
ncbi:MAG: transketolase family protein [Clostridiales bacterium]|nr:transketolase family protein [Clostridiales bacterium]